MKSGPLTEDEQKIIITMRERKCGYKKIAKALNRKTDTVAKWCRKNGYAGTATEWSIQEQEVRQRIADRYTGFEYVNGYDGSEGMLTIRCTVCGHVFERTSQIIRPSRAKKIICTNCQEINIQQTKQKKALSKEIRNKIKRLKKQFNKLELIAERIEKENKVCQECGRAFVAEHLSRKYCSVECKRRMSNRNREITRRTREINNGRKDSDISLDRLIKRDKNKCYICGNRCDKNDHQIEGGYFIAGENYPSIDHVVPLSKGGTHTWDNIKLAHFICNSKKRDDLLYE